MKVKVSEIIYREDLYPRTLTSPETVQDYAQNIEIMPPVEVNQNNILIDGWHRWTAHKKLCLTEIEVIVTHTEREKDVLFLAIERNNAHGLQLSQEDKQLRARELYHATPAKDRAEFKKELARLFSVPYRTLQNWLSRIDKDNDAARDKRIFDKWLACWKQEEIGESEELSQPQVNALLSEFANLQKLIKSKQTLATFSEPEWSPPIYNVWKQQNKTSGSNHFGNSEPRWLENLLYLYTNPFDIVVDPFAGGGSTIDLCKKRGRRYFVSDRKPIVERETEIRKWDVTDGLPPLPRWKDVKLVYLDPPYWKQAEGKYSQDPSDLSNMDLSDFNKHLSGLICGFAKKLSNAYIALLIQPTQWNAPNREYTDHAADMIRAINLPIHMRFQCPYESQQANAQMVEWSKENKTPLVLSRELIVWSVK